MSLRIEIEIPDGKVTYNKGDEFQNIEWGSYRGVATNTETGGKGPVIVKTAKDKWGHIHTTLHLPASDNYVPKPKKEKPHNMAY